MVWNGPETWHDGILERPFLVPGRGNLQGAVWRPELPGPRPLVLLSHGGSGHSRSSAMRHTVQGLVRQGAFQVACIDGPVHGSRSPCDPDDAQQVIENFRRHWRTGDGGREAMLQDWQAALTLLLSAPQVDAGRVGFMGLSMGTAYGLRLCARDARIRACVLGLWSSDYPNSESLLAEAAALSLPTLFVQKLDDEWMSRAGQMRLFEAIGGPGKQMNIYPGTHGQAAPALLDDACRFLTTQLHGADLDRGDKRTQVAPSA